MTEPFSPDVVVNTEVEAALVVMGVVVIEPDEEEAGTELDTDVEVGKLEEELDVELLVAEAAGEADA